MQLKMKNRIVIKKDSFLVNTESELEAIYDYFNEFKVAIEETDEAYYVELQREDYSYCEDLSYGMSELRVTDIENQLYYDGGCGVCFSENWLPYINSMIKKKEKTDFSILHFDDHSDLMPPYICKENDGFFDMITRKPISFDDSIDIYNCVMSGAITIGSMLTGIVYSTNQKVDIFHIKRNCDTFIGWYEKSTMIDDFMEASVNRIKIDIDDAMITPNSGKYIRSSDLKTIESNLGLSDDIILHIDMDYFNNRYNGSSDWRTEWKDDDFDLSDQKKLINNIVEFIVNNNLNKRIKKVLIGISPSFYPAEYWKTGLYFLVNQLCLAGLNLDKVKESIEAGDLFNETKI